MTMIISFAWTSRAVVAGHKTVTRRLWSASHARKFAPFDLVHAYDKSPRAHGQLIATLQLTAAPYLEFCKYIPDEDYDNEGFAYLSRFPGATDAERSKTLDLAAPENFQRWRIDRRSVAMHVVRFRVVSVTTYGISLLSDNEVRELAGRLSLSTAAARSFPAGARLPIVATVASIPGRIDTCVSSVVNTRIEGSSRSE